MEEKVRTVRTKNQLRERILRDEWFISSRFFTIKGLRLVEIGLPIIRRKLNQ